MSDGVNWSVKLTRGIAVVMNSKGDFFFLYSTTTFETNNFLAILWNDGFIFYSCTLWGCVVSAIPSLCSGALNGLLTLSSFPVLPLPTHHEKKKSKLHVNLTDMFKVKNSFTSLPLWVPAFSWTLCFEHSLISFPFADAFKHIFKLYRVFIGNSGLYSLLFDVFRA